MSDNIFISCGEPSGDVYAAALIRALLLRRPGLKIWGMLGPLGVSAGAIEFRNYNALHLMGIIEVIPAIPRLFRLRRELVDEIIRLSPSVVVVIDSPDFHLPLVKKLRNEGYKGKIVYLVTPTVWAWRAGRAKTLKQCCDLCLPLFSFENKWLAEYGINTAWHSHPLVEHIKNIKHIKNFAPSIKLESKFDRQNYEKKNGKIIAFMPGSRSYDIKWHLDTLIESAGIMRSLGYIPVFSIAPGLHGQLREKLKNKIIEAGFEYSEAEGRELLALCDAAVAVSGTISVEAMLLRKFMVVVYNGNFLSWIVWKTLIHTPFISIPNLLSGGDKSKMIFPELVGSDMKAENIAGELCSYFDNPDKKHRIDNLISDAVCAMGEGDAAEFWASQILT